MSGNNDAEVANIWFVRAGSGNVLIGDYLSKKRMAIGLRGTDDFRNFDDLKAVENHIKSTPNWKHPERFYGGGAARYGVRFFSDVEVDDLVFLMKGAKDLAAVGTVKSNYEFYQSPSWETGKPDYCHIRNVDWLKVPSVIETTGVAPQSGFGPVNSATAKTILNLVLAHVSDEDDGPDPTKVLGHVVDWLSKVSDTKKGNRRKQDSNEYYFGEIQGADVGTIFRSRRELYDANVHRTLQAGIVGRQHEGAESVVLSGGYVDDEDYGDVIVYTGDGGQDDKRNQVSDQDFEGKNRALVRNHLDDIPVRVIRGGNHRSEYSPDDGYRYDGLFKVERYWRERGKHGFLVCRFRLVRQSGQEIELPQSILDEDSADDAPARRTEATVNRLVRDRRLAQKIKDLYQYRCQVCGERIEVDGGHYAEAAHIKPLGRPHDGPDTLENLLCLCPNHHVAFDNGGLFFSDDLSVNGDDKMLSLSRGHKPSAEFIAYHRSIWGR
jgi:putative restriction endonuclease